MEAINKTLQALAKRLSSINLDLEEEYILSREEEEQCIEDAIIGAKKHAAWKMAQILHTPEQIEQKLSEINWQEKIDIQNVLQYANMCKLQNEWHKHQRIKEAIEEKKKQEELRLAWTAKRVYQLMAWTSKSVYGKNLIVNESNKKFITALCFFISRDERFETELGYSLKKGLLIRGTSGLGKTYLVKCIKENRLNPILIESMIDIADTIRSSGEYQIEMNDRKIIYLDDVGTEENVIKHYGTTINFFKNFIEGIYLRSQNFANLIISTNNSFQEIEEKYGFRVRSRIKDMFNILDITGNDMRG